ncbi:MAG: PAS domain-containing protein [Bacteroidota bacterium]
MRKTPESKYSKQAGSSKKFLAAVSDHILHHLAFNNSFQANIITIVSTGKIIIANHAACKLLGYSRRELLTKSRSSIFDIKESAFKNLLKQRTAEGHSKALATAVKKNGRLIPSEITSAVFIDEDGIEKAITTIADMSLSILKQKKIDTEKDKIVAGNIALAKTKQKGIDTKRRRKSLIILLLPNRNKKRLIFKKTK